MRSLTAVLLISILFATSVAFTDPQWAIVSTEVDEFLDGSGFMQRHALKLDAPNFTWVTGSPFWFDPGDVIGSDTGLDAYHYSGPSYNGGTHYFSAEQDFWYEDVYYEDEDLMVYDVVSGILSELLDVKDVLGMDYGLDAACFVDDLWVFSTEVGGVLDRQGGFETFTDGDIIVINDDGPEVFSLLEYFGRNVGLDALHAFYEESERPEGNDYLQIIMSTEVDGSIYDPETMGDIFFKDEDILSLSFEWDDIGDTWNLNHAEVPWEGVEDGFGSDVGLDALYIVPEPSTMLIIGIGLSIFVKRFRKR